MATVVSPAAPLRPIARKLAQLRRLVRLYVALEGIAAVVVVLGTAFWAGLAFDWLFEPPAPIRVLLGVAVGLVLAMVVIRLLGQRLFRELPDESLALLVERRYPTLNDGLATAINGPQLLAAGAAHPALLERTTRRAVEVVEGLPLGPIFNWRPLLRTGAAALALLASIAGLALVRGDVFAFWLERLQLSEQPWPRQVALSVPGFVDRDGQLTANVAQGDEYEVVVEASLLDGHVAPEEVEIRWRTPADGARGSGAMIRVGEAEPGRDAAQSFRYLFKASSDIVFDVVGGDARLRNLRLRVVPRPVVQAISVACVYPAYLQRAANTLPASQRVDLPAGSTATCRIEFSKPIAALRALRETDQQPLPGRVAAENARVCLVEVGRIDQDVQLAVTMTDDEGVAMREPYRLILGAVPDELPEPSVQLRGIGTAVTPQARIPLEGRLSDDYGLAESWFAYQVDDQPPASRGLKQAVAGKFEVRAFEPFDLDQREPGAGAPGVTLSPGQRLSFALEARDYCDLREPPQVGTSQRFVLDVVTPSELRGLLERRELALRQRFEAIHEKMLGAVDLLDRLATPGAAPPAPDAAAEASGPEPDQAEAATAARQRDASRVVGAGQTATQLAFETLGVSEGFEEIVEELENNRIDTEELKQRLLVGVAEPLREIGAELLPRLESNLQNLRGPLLEGTAEGAALLAAVRAEARAVEQAMREVLDRMLELESYNELVELLREIVKQQEQLNDRTRAKQRDRLRDLLED
jgi:hypothetical protein